MSWRPSIVRESVRRTGALMFVLGSGLGSVDAIAGDACTLRTEYRQLRQSLKHESGEKTLTALEGYATAHGTLTSCEAIDIDRRLSTIEQPQFAFASSTRRVDSQAVFRCNDIDAVTARCIGPVEDATARPNMKRLRSRPAGPVLMLSTRHQASLHRVYTTSVADAIEGRPATAMPLVNGRVTLPSAAEVPSGLVLIAIYQSSGAWRYRKAVWYF